MTHDYHKPTHTFPSGAYNATQVRLYGIYNTEKLTVQPGEINIGGFRIRIGNSGYGDDVENSADDSEAPEVNVIKFEDRSGNPVFVTTLKPVPKKDDHHVAEDDDDDKCKCCKCKKNRAGSIGIIYGYAYEGHCYDLPRPMVMLLPVPPEEPVERDDPRNGIGNQGWIPSKDCDYDGRPGYRVWVVDKLDQCDVIDITSGFVEQLVLDANKPGRRSPSTYSAHMQFAHRSGRMPE